MLDAKVSVTNGFVSTPVQMNALLVLPACRYMTHMSHPGVADTIMLSTNSTPDSRSVSTYTTRPQKAEDPQA